MKYSKFCGKSNTIPTSNANKFNKYFLYLVKYLNFYSCLLKNLNFSKTILIDVIIVAGLFRKSYYCYISIRSLNYKTDPITSL